MNKKTEDLQVFKEKKEVVQETLNKGAGRRKQRREPDILEVLNRSYADSSKEKQRASEKKVRGDVLRFYQQAMDEKGFLEITFHTTTLSGDLVSIEDSGVQLVLEASVMKQAFPSYSKETREFMTGVPMRVRVKSVTPERVTFSCDGLVSTDVLKALNIKLSRRLHPSVYGTVVRVNTGNVIVDIFDMGIYGVIPSSKWRKEYSRDLTHLVSEGDIIRAQVIARNKKDDLELDVAFVMSHESFAENPWCQIPDVIEEGSLLMVKCIEMPLGKSYFWGISPAVRGIEIMCDYGASVHSNIHVGGIYKCQVFRLDVKNKRFQVVPFRKASSSYQAETPRKAANKKRQIDE